MSAKCKAFSESKLGLAPIDNRQAFYAGWEAAIASITFNFCPRCGKRTYQKDGVHTCTPPVQENSMNEEQLKVWESSLMEKLKAENEAQSRHIIELQKEFMTVKEKLLRDHFAGLAMQGIVSSSGLWPASAVAKMAYQTADAMLAERERGK